MVSRNASYEPFPWTNGTKAGGTLFAVVAENVPRRPIDLRFETPVVDLITNEEGGILALVVEAREVLTGEITVDSGQRVAGRQANTTSRLSAPPSTWRIGAAGWRSLPKPATPAPRSTLEPLRSCTKGS